MTEYNIGFRHSFKSKIKEFCKNNEIEIKNIVYYGSGKNDDYYMLNGDISKFNLLEEYVKKLEEQRNNKNWLYKLFF